MQSNQPVANDQDDNVVPFSGPKGPKKAWIYENLRTLFDHFTREKADTDERLAAIVLDNAETDIRVDKLDAQTQDLKASSDRLTRKTAALTSSGERLSQQLESVAASLKDSLSDLDRRSDTTEAELAALGEQVRHIEATAAKLNSRTESQVRRTLDLEAGERHLLEETGGLKSRIAEMEPRQQSLEDSNRRLLADTEALSGKTGQLSNHFRKAAWVIGGSILVLAIAIGATSWTSNSRIDGISVGTHQQVSEVRSDLTASIERFETSGPAVAAVEQKISALQSQFDQNIAGNIDLETETAKLSEEVRRLTLMNAQLESELGVVKDRMYSPDDGLQGTLFDLSTVRNNSWLKTQNPNHYVIQIVSVYRKQDLANFIARYQQYLPLDQLSYSKTVHRGRDMYVLFLGSYGEFNEAIKQLEAIPPALQKNRPYTRTLRSVQRRMS